MHHWFPAQTETRTEGDIVTWTANSDDVLNELKRIARENKGQSGKIGFVVTVIVGGHIYTAERDLEISYPHLEDAGGRADVYLSLTRLNETLATLEESYRKEHPKSRDDIPYSYVVQINLL